MTDQVTNENILRKCIVCQEEKETSKFRLNRTTCRKCCSKSQNAVLKNKNYFANKYQEMACMQRTRTQPLNTGP